jgi:hypothetical protein
MGRPGEAPGITSEALRRTARGRVDLYRSLIAVEQAAARPAVNREHDWLEGLREAVEELRDEIETHVELTEGVDGLYEEVAEVAPRLGGRLEALRREHVEMRMRAADTAARLAARDADESAVDAARADVSALLGFLVKHRQRGSDLVWEAYALDIGGVE